MKNFIVLIVSLFSISSFAAEKLKPANDTDSTCEALILSLSQKITGEKSATTYRLSHIDNLTLMNDAMISEYPSVDVIEYLDGKFFVKIGVNQYRSVAGDQIEYSKEANGSYSTRKVISIKPLNGDETIFVIKSIYNNGYGKLTTVIEVQYQADEKSTAQTVATFSEFSQP